MFSKHTLYIYKCCSPGKWAPVKIQKGELQTMKESPILGQSPDGILLVVPRIPRDPITEPENGFMQPKYLSFRWLYTP